MASDVIFAKQIPTPIGSPTKKEPAPKRSQRSGTTYEQLKTYPKMVELLLDGNMPHTVAAERLGVTPGAVSRALEALRYDYAYEQSDNLETDEHLRLLPRGALAIARKASGTDRDGFDDAISELVEGFIAFQDRFFEVRPGQPFIVKPFHRKWMKLIIEAWTTGSKQLILSPPRHGKSELLIRFAVWTICMDFNIRIMWVCASEAVAKLMLGSVKDHLENNQDLISFVLGRGAAFKPPRVTSKVWTSTELKINQMNVVGQKSSTVLALGRTSKILSRDVDLLIVDDLEDFDSTREPSQREYSRQKFAEIGTRKEEHTAWINICSRQHPDDLAKSLSDSASEQGWKVTVHSAHDEDGCTLDPEIIAKHDTNDCVLFPEVRSYAWLMEKKAEMDDLGLDGAYEMRYLNRPRPVSGMVFKIPVIRDLCLDRSRDVGVEGLGVGRMIAGLDPAARGTQAAFGWLWTSSMIYMIDLETQEAGGFEGAFRVLIAWDDAYGMKDWKYESSSQQVEFFRDPRLRDVSVDRGISVRPHHTGKNKQSYALGLTAMAPLYHAGRINLPYGTVEARRKTNVLLRQLENWTLDGEAGRRRKTDVRMASWFPFPTMLKWNKEERNLGVHLHEEMSYPSLNTMSSVGWETQYPRR
jgi:hypothetical protein